MMALHTPTMHMFLNDQTAKCQYGDIRVVHVHVCKTQRVLHQGDNTEEMSYAKATTLGRGCLPSS